MGLKVSTPLGQSGPGSNDIKEKKSKKEEERIFFYNHLKRMNSLFRPCISYFIKKKKTLQEMIILSDISD